jgi:integrase
MTYLQASTLRIDCHEFGIRHVRLARADKGGGFTQMFEPLASDVLRATDSKHAAVLQNSGHSLRRGFANWAMANGWDLKTLMEYVGWKNVQSAMRYVEAADPFAKRRIERALPAALQLGDVTQEDVKP